MSNRILKFAATAGATVLLAGFGTVAAGSASAATAPAATTATTHSVPVGIPGGTPAHVPAHGGWWCDDGINLLWLICLDVDVD